MPTVFPEAAAFPELALLADIDEATAATAARRLGFARHTGDWRRLVTDPAIDIVDICVPSNLHREIALAAIAAGKNVYCEKPVGLSDGEASEIATAAGKAGVKSLVGYHLPAQSAGRLRAAPDQSGAIGRRCISGAPITRTTWRSPSGLHLALRSGDRRRRRRAGRSGLPHHQPRPPAGGRHRRGLRHGPHRDH